jgi:ABC-2 type transport system permease protein
MNFNHIYAVALRQYYLLRSGPTRIVPYFLWSTLDVIVWGFITKFLGNITTEGFAIAVSLLGAIILWDFFIRAMQGVTTAFFEDVWSKNFLNIFASPLSLGEYVTGLSITSIITSILAFLVVIIVALTSFGFSFAFLGLSILPFMLVLFLIGIALGIFAVGIVLRLGPSAEWFIWPIPALLTPFAGVYYPVSTLPVWMQWVAHVLPPSYVFEGMRSVIQTGRFATGDLVIATVLSLVYIALAYLFLRRIYRLALKTGLIARYSAESTV